MNSERLTSVKVEKMLAVKGMNDILPGESARWEALETAIRGIMRRYAYENIRTPVVEPTALFVRGTGQSSDIVMKEMYSFEDRLNGEALTLRPENTPGVVRAAIEHNLTYDGGKRLYYMGPMFRHERPQRGRYRQFYQLGVEAIGFAGPEVDAEIILLAHALFQELGLKNVRVELKSLGVVSERQAHRLALISYFEQHVSLFDEDAKKRLHTNPLRILDTKNPALKEIVSNAPMLIDFLGADSMARFDAVKASLTAAEVPWTINPLLVRGLDYYSHTVFEFYTDELGAQGALIGGGRYDGLFELLGGKPTPAVGWGLGMERVLDLLEHQGAASCKPLPHAYAIVPDPAALPQVMQCLQKLRALGLQILMHAGPTSGVASMKSQFKKADASGAMYALVFGADEVANGQVTVKSLRDGVGVQTIYPLADPAQWALKLQSNA
ncbi:MAG: histidine--tRNA ligase [Burkholderiales bacterium PBB4]|nr:MAG: histidine--tRNA ligase [Burkholderiales bacterium PBB4]